MRVLKNLFGKKDKIHIDEIAYKDKNGAARLLSEGIIVESGNNNNGNYIKFADGTMECYVSELTLKHTDNSNYRDAFWYFPAAFAEKPAVLVSHRAPFDSSFMRNVPPLRTVSNTINATRIIQNAPDGKVFPKEDYFTVSVMAIGRWK